MCCLSHRIDEGPQHSDRESVEHREASDSRLPGPWRERWSQPIAFEVLVGCRPNERRVRTPQQKISYLPSIEFSCWNWDIRNGSRSSTNGSTSPCMKWHANKAEKVKRFYYPTKERQASNSVQVTAIMTVDAMRRCHRTSDEVTRTDVVSLRPKFWNADSGRPLCQHAVRVLISQRAKA